MVIPLSVLKADTGGVRAQQKASGRFFVPEALKSLTGSLTAKTAPGQQCQKS